LPSKNFLLLHAKNKYKDWDIAGTPGTSRALGESFFVVTSFIYRFASFANFVLF